MPDKVFIDSNIIIYAYSVDEPKKLEIARDILLSNETILSTQTINEFVSVTTRKRMLNNAQIAEIIDDLFLLFSIHPVDQKIIQKALTLTEKYRYSYFDSLMVASALAADCSILYSEDMHHSHVIEKKLKIINPFHVAKMAQ